MQEPHLTPESSLGRAARRAAVGAGIALTGGAILGSFVGSDSGFGRTQVLGLLLGGVLLGFGVAGRSAPRLHRGLALVLLNTLILMLALELAAAVVNQVVFRVAPETRERSAFYDTVDWGSDFWAEEARAVSRYHPYVVYRRAPFAGEHINIDSRGIRRTPGSTCRPDAFTVFAFGGSTMWGQGVPDWGTVPAHLHRRLAEQRDGPVCVVNYGELGFTSTQGVIQLMRVLQRGRVPDLALFYGGVNDEITAQMYGQPGLHWHMNRIAEQLEDGNEESLWLGQLNLVRLLRRLLPDPDPLAEPGRWRPGPVDSAPALGRAVAELYLRNVRAAQALAKSYGFEAAFFWQPHTMTGAKRLTPEEVRMVESEGLLRTHPEFRLLIDAANRRVQEAARVSASLHDIRDLFDDVDSLVYVDWHHLTPEGNDMVAAQMIELLGHRTGAGATP